MEWRFSFSPSLVTAFGFGCLAVSAPMALTTRAAPVVPESAFARSQVPSPHGVLAGPRREPSLGMYIHLGWSYNHPYAARTWTLEDWRGYLDGLRRLGFNMVLIWPLLETMPEPLTPSDEACLQKISTVIDLAHLEFSQKAYIVLCPNVAVNNEEAAKSSFEKRLFYHTDRRVDPGDPVAFGPVIAWREKLLRRLKAMDGLFIIDSDPGGYANSTDLEFVYIMGAHRRLLDRLGEGKELYYWAHAGWEAYARYYATGQFRMGPPEELRATVALLAKQRCEPWGVAVRLPNFADPIGMGDRVMAFPYGAIESEPSFPLTLFGQERVLSGAQHPGQRGILGNTQTPCMQLPNTFAFARVAQGQSVERSDYVRFANDLLPGRGEAIVAAWEALQGEDVTQIKNVIIQLEMMHREPVTVGALSGLLFGDGSRFIDDLVRQLRMAASAHALNAAVDAEPRDPARIRQALREFVAAAESWQNQHGYSDSWHWLPLDHALGKLNAPLVKELEKLNSPSAGEGATPAERIANRRARLETYTLQLLAALRLTADSMDH